MGASVVTGEACTSARPGSPREGPSTWTGEGVVNQAHFVEGVAGGDDKGRTDIRDDGGKSPRRMCIRDLGLPKGPLYTFSSR